MGCATDAYVPVTKKKPLLSPVDDTTPANNLSVGCETFQRHRFSVLVASQNPSESKSIGEQLTAANTREL